jgi:hypothetical protein
LLAIVGTAQFQWYATVCHGGSVGSRSPEIHRLDARPGRLHRLESRSRARHSAIELREAAGTNRTSPLESRLPCNRKPFAAVLPFATAAGARAPTMTTRAPPATASALGDVFGCSTVNFDIRWRILDQHRSRCNVNTRTYRAEAERVRIDDGVGPLEANESDRQAQHQVIGDTDQDEFR